MTAGNKLSHYFKEIGYAFCKQSQQYFCRQCMDQAVYLTYCSRAPSEGCCCHNVLHFTPNCDKCECGNVIFDVDALEAAECDCECCLFISCDICEKTTCKIVGTTHVEFVRSATNMRYGLDELCINCYREKSQKAENTKECNTCKIKCSLRHNILPHAFYAENDRLPMLIKCSRAECDTYVCYACGEGGHGKEEWSQDGIYERCTDCHQIMYPSTLCTVHAEEIQLTCCQCFYMNQIK
eukprot:755993_1